MQELKRMGFSEVGCGMVRGLTVAMFTIAAFSAVSWIMKHSLVERKIIPYLNVFGDISAVPFLLMSLLYFVAYIVNEVYVEVARMFSCSKTLSECKNTRSSTACNRSSASSSAGDDYVFKLMDGVRTEFIGRLPGFIMAYVCATVAKVSIQVRVALTMIYAFSMVMWMMTTIFGISILSRFFSCIAHVCCFKLFFYSYVPNYAIISGSLGKSFGNVIGNVQEIFRKLKIN